MYILILSRNLTPSSLVVGSSSGTSTWVGPATLLAPSDVLVLKYTYRSWLYDTCMVISEETYNMYMIIKCR
jgi:hypothetical protein